MGFARPGEFHHDESQDLVQKARICPCTMIVQRIAHVLYYFAHRLLAVAANHAERIPCVDHWRFRHSDFDPSSVRKQLFSWSKGVDTTKA
jgi:hypothetical protein